VVKDMPPKKKDDSGNASAKKDEFRDIEKDTELKNEYEFLGNQLLKLFQNLFLLKIKT
jgi:hypothetical protein